MIRAAVRLVGFNWDCIAKTPWPFEAAAVWKYFWDVMESRVDTVPILQVKEPGYTWSLRGLNHPCICICICIHYTLK